MYFWGEDRKGKKVRKRRGGYILHLIQNKEDDVFQRNVFKDYTKIV